MDIAAASIGLAAYKTQMQVSTSVLKMTMDLQNTVAGDLLTELSAQIADIPDTNDIAGAVQSATGHLDLYI